MTELLLHFPRLSLLGFGGPVPLVGQMEREIVDVEMFIGFERANDCRITEKDNDYGYHRPNAFDRS